MKLRRFVRRNAVTILFVGLLIALVLSFVFLPAEPFGAVVSASLLSLTVVIIFRALVIFAYRFASRILVAFSLISLITGLIIVGAVIINPRPAVELVLLLLLSIVLVLVSIQLVLMRMLRAILKRD